MTILYGTNLTSPSDELKKISIDYLYNSLRNPKPVIESRIRQLRIIRDLDAKQYSILKRQLPYLVMGAFNPPYRKTDNFAYIEYFIIDFDKFTSKGIDLQNIRKQIEQDERVLLSFTSPSKDGLKVMFHLKERCYDAGLYSLFYKAFLYNFSTMYQLEQVADKSTSDVCRACFISIDPEAFYRPNAVTIDLGSYIDLTNPDALFNLKHKQDKQEKETPSINEEKEESKDPDSDILGRIKARLNPNGKTVILEKTPVFVPERLNEIINDLKQYVEDTGVGLYEIKDIQYGKKLRFRLGNKIAELNLFYGKHGFTVVQSPKCGTSSELNKLMSELVQSFIITIS